MSHVCDTPACQLCDKPFKPGDTLIDGNTVFGWAVICDSCHAAYGCGLGTGRGQKYEHGNPQKVEG